jgi:hypothetical protein
MPSLSEANVHTGLGVFGISFAVGFTVIFGRADAAGVVADLDNFAGRRSPERTHG